MVIMAMQTVQSDETLKYPIGRFKAPTTITEQQRREWIDELERLPASFENATSDLDVTQLDTPYRPGGWTVRQLVHHVADSHMNSYVRFRLALTEVDPLIKPYNEALWAELADARTMPIHVSLQLLKSLHARWVHLLLSFSDDDFKKTFRHPEMGGVPLDRALALYAWHGRHHLAHITHLCAREDWFGRNTLRQGQFS